MASLHSLKSQNTSLDVTKNALPNYICNNPRENVEPEQIPSKQIETVQVIRTQDAKSIKSGISRYPEIIPFVIPPQCRIVPVPLHPIVIDWEPEYLKFVLSQDTIVNRLKVNNRSSRRLFVHCCGIWNERARLGAFWKCFPKTNFILAPGLGATVSIEAIPQDSAEIPGTVAFLQLAAAHMRDNVVGHFSVPVQVEFKQYNPDVSFEGE